MNYSQQLDDILSRIYRIGAFVVVPIGLVLNFLQYLVFKSKVFDKSNIGFQMRVHIVFDSIALFYSSFILIYWPSMDSNLLLNSEAICFLSGYIGKVMQQVPFYLQMFFSYINYLSVTWPAKHISFSKKRNLILGYMVILVFLILVNTPNLFNRIVYDYGQNGTALAKTCRASPLMNSISEIEIGIVRSLVPLTIISILNVLTIRAIINPRTRLNISIENEKKFRNSLLIRNFLFLVFNFPFFFARLAKLIFVHDKYEDDYGKYDGDDYKMTIFFIYACARSFSFIYYGLGFIPNFLFNRLFQNICFKFLQKLEKPCLY